MLCRFMMAGDVCLYLELPMLNVSSYADDMDCCLEKCCLNSFYGENGKYIGKGCCFQPCCNPCNANCCMMNTIYVSTNDPRGLMNLLNTRTDRGMSHNEEVEI